MCDTIVVAARTGQEGWVAVEEGIPPRRAGEPVDTASVVLFLFSDLSRYITAQSIAVDGGATTMDYKLIPSNVQSGTKSGA